MKYFTIIFLLAIGALLGQAAALDDAKWLKATDTPAMDGPLCTSIEADMTIVKGNPAVIFGWTATRAYFQWQLITDAPEGLLLRRCVRTFTDNPPYEDAAIPGFTPEDVLGKQIHLCIKASGKIITTYLNGIEIDTYRRTRSVPKGKAGFRVGLGDEMLVDNFLLSASLPDGQSRTIAQEDFSGPESLYFIDADIADGQCRVATTAAEFKLLTVDESYPTFYKFFDADKPIALAKLYASALGLYDLWINGERVGARNSDGSATFDELKPGWTDFNKRVAYSEYDVTALCQEGRNSIGAIVAPGWLQGKVAREQYKYPLDLAFIAKLEIEYADGAKETIATDSTWCTEKYSPLLKSDIYNGEFFDARRALPWANEDAILPCTPQIFEYPGQVEPWRGPTVRAMKESMLQPVKTVVYADVDKPNRASYGQINVLRASDGQGPICLKAGETAVVDFGQNCAGVPMLSVKGECGARLHVRFGEALNDTGEKARGNDGPAGSLYTANLRNAKAELYYVLRGDAEGETYMPSTTFFGYRYCEITATGDVVIEGVESCPLSSSHQITGWFETDNDEINRLYSNILWSQLSNFISIPTDCPQRDERLGWTADAQLFATTAMYNADVADFYGKWLQDMRDSQREDGAYSDVTPLSLVKYGSAGWADAGITVPWQIYIMTGRKDAMQEHFESMESYMSWLSTLKEDGLSYPGAYTTYGDLFAQNGADMRFVSQAYYYYDAVLMAKMCQVLNAGEEKALMYSRLAEAIKQEMQSIYFDKDGLLEPTQSGCVISLWFGLCASDAQQQGIIEALVRLIVENGYRLDTGFISTAYVLQTLSDFGYDEVAYDVLTQHDYPSWLYMVDNGATTMWENWYCYKPERGFNDVHACSFNHFGLGSFGSWMFSHMAGIMACEEKPGFEKVIFSPSVDPRMSHSTAGKVRRAKAVKKTPYGDISAEWRIRDHILTYNITVPDGVEGEVRLPVPSPATSVYEGWRLAEQSELIQPLGWRCGRKAYAVKAGEYHFKTLHLTDRADFKLWPNPAQTVINITCPEHIKEVEIISLSGAIMLRQPSRAAAEQEALSNTEIDVSAFAPGLYLAKIHTLAGYHILKFIKI